MLMPSGWKSSRYRRIVSDKGTGATRARVPPSLSIRGAILRCHPTQLAVGRAGSQTIEPGVRELLGQRPHALFGVDLVYDRADGGQAILADGPRLVVATDAAVLRVGH